MNITLRSNQIQKNINELLFLLSIIKLTRKLGNDKSNIIFH